MTLLVTQLYLQTEFDIRTMNDSRLTASQSFSRWIFVTVTNLSPKLPFGSQ